MQTKKYQKKRSNETKSCFFEKTHKIDKPLSRLTKEKRGGEAAQIDEIRNEKLKTHHS